MKKNEKVQFYSVLIVCLLEFYVCESKVYIEYSKYLNYKTENVPKIKFIVLLMKGFNQVKYLVFDIFETKSVKPIITSRNKLPCVNTLK